MKTEDHLALGCYLHDAYAAAAHSMETDCKFIFAACSSLLRQELARIPVPVMPEALPSHSASV